MVSILDRTLIIDLCIRFIHNYYWFKTENEKNIHIGNNVCTRYECIFSK